MGLLTRWPRAPGALGSVQAAALAEAAGGQRGLSIFCVWPGTC